MKVICVKPFNGIEGSLNSPYIPEVGDICNVTGTHENDRYPGEQYYQIAEATDPNAAYNSKNFAKLSDNFTTEDIECEVLEEETATA